MNAVQDEQLVGVKRKPVSEKLIIGSDERLGEIVYSVIQIEQIIHYHTSH
jgi:hypothetical protein